MTTNIECTVNCQVPKVKKESISLRDRIALKMTAFRIHGAENMSKFK